MNDNKRNAFFLNNHPEKEPKETKLRSFVIWKYFIWDENLAYHKNKIYKNLVYWSRDVLNFDFQEKDLGIIYSQTFCVCFFKKNVSHVPFYYLTNFHSLIAFASWDIKWYVYGNCLFPKLRRYKFWK